MKVTDSKAKAVFSSNGRMKTQEKKVYDFLLEHKDSFVSMSIKTIARESGVSTPTVVRFCKTMGYKGLKDFKIHFNLFSNDSIATKPITWDMDDSSITLDFKAKTTFAIEKFFSQSNRDAFFKASDALATADNTFVVGIGGSAIVAEYLHKELMRYGKKGNLLSDTYIMRHSINAKKGDVAVIISCSGNNPPVNSTASRAKAAGCFLISLTNNPKSSLADISDIVIVSTAVTSLEDEGDAFSRLTHFTGVNVLTLLTAIRLGRTDSTYRNNFSINSNHQNFLGDM